MQDKNIIGESVIIMGKRWVDIIKIYIFNNILRHKVLLRLLMFGVIICIPPNIVYADGSYKEAEKEGNDAWAASLKCITWIGENNNIQIAYRVLNSDRTQYIKVLEVDKKGVVLTERKVELPYYYWGGEILNGEDGYFYVAVGQGSDNEEDVIYCFLKYDKNWNEVGRCEIKRKECYSEVPFSGGNCDMILSKGTLIVNTCKTMPPAYDGKRHQGSHKFYINCVSMNLIGGTGVSFDISHSFNQMVIKSSDRIAFLDHGDASPRSIYVKYFQEPEEYTDNNIKKLHYDKCSVMKFNGNIGENRTEVKVSGFYSGNNSNCIVGAGINHSILDENTWRNTKSSNLYEIIMSADFKTYECKFLTSYDMFGDIGVTDLYTVQEGEKIYILYEVKDDKTEKSQTGLMITDMQGSIISNILTDQPFCCNSSVSVIDGTIYWAYYDNTPLGTFLISCDWKEDEKYYHAYNIDTKYKSNIKNLEWLKDGYSSDDIVLEEGEEQQIELDVMIKNGLSEEILDEIQISEAPVVWSLDNECCTLVGNASKLDNTLSTIDDKYNYKITYNTVVAQKPGKSKLTVQIGDKKIVIPVKVKRASVEKVKSVKVVSGKKKLIVNWKKYTDCSGYQIQLSKRKNYSKATTFNIKKTKKQYVIKKLQSRKKYYIRIRAYKKYKNKMIYSKWVKVSKKTK
ncbi:MAG: fibronectin type III domain-containing protein [Lachnospiraceae bacterium]|nr:fibronectin type III domain-containing protein [Lachnospiraceae bacterium]